MKSQDLTVLFFQQREQTLDGFYSHFKNFKVCVYYKPTETVDGGRFFIDCNLHLLWLSASRARFAFALHKMLRWKRRLLSLRGNNAPDRPLSRSERHTNKQNRFKMQLTLVPRIIELS